MTPRIAAHEARVLPFRRRRQAPRRRRPNRLLLLLRLFGAAAAIVTAPVALLVWIATSPRLALRHLEVEGAHRVDRAWVEGLFTPLYGRSLLWLSLGPVEGELLRHPWIEGVEIAKRLPDQLSIRVVERQPAALLRQGVTLSYLDRHGRVIAPFAPEVGPADLLLVTAPGASPREIERGLEVAGEFARLNPDWGAGLSELEIVGEDDYRLVTAALPFPVLVSADGLALGTERLRELLPEIERHYGELDVVDLRFARRIVLQPAARTAGPLS